MRSYLSHISLEVLCCSNVISIKTSVSTCFQTLCIITSRPSRGVTYTNSQCRHPIKSKFSFFQNKDFSC